MVHNAKMVKATAGSEGFSILYDYPFCYTYDVILFHVTERKLAALRCPQARQAVTCTGGPDDPSRGVLAAVCSSVLPLSPSSSHVEATRTRSTMRDIDGLMQAIHTMSPGCVQSKWSQTRCASSSGYPTSAC
jgi:hypothetical protein